MGPGGGPAQRDPPLPVGASLRRAGMEQAAAQAEGEAAGLPVLGEHCWEAASVTAPPVLPTPPLPHLQEGP